MNNKKKILYIFPRVVDTVLQNTTENEIARALRKIDYEIDTIVAYEQEKTPLDGFSDTVYYHKPNPGMLSSLRYHFALLGKMVATDAGTVLINFPAMHLLPFAKLLSALKGRRPLWLMDIRSVPVDTGNDLWSRMIKMRYRLAIFLADWLCDGMTVITPALGETVLPRLRRLRNKLGFWASGVTLEHFTTGDRSMRKELGLEGKTVLIYHGIMSPNRGLGDLVQAVSILSREYPALRLLFVGGGPGITELQQTVSKLNLQQVITFVDAVPYEEIHRYIAAADAGVLPFPNIEWWAVSSPLKLMEYFAMGLPVIATDIRAIRQLIDTTRGAILARDSSPKALAAAIKDFLDNGCTPATHDILEDTISWNAQARSIDVFIRGLQS